MKRIALVWCSERLGTTFQRMFLDTFRQPGEQWDVLSAADPEFEALATGYDGYVISGSEKSVVEDAQTPLVARLLGWLSRTAETSASPVLGICFGAHSGGKWGAIRGAASGWAWRRLSVMPPPTASAGPNWTRTRCSWRATANAS